MYVEQQNKKLDMDEAMPQSGKKSLNVGKAGMQKEHPGKHSLLVVGGHNMTCFWKEGGWSDFRHSVVVFKIDRGFSEL